MAGSERGESPDSAGGGSRPSRPSRDRFVPYRKREVVEMLLAAAGSPGPLAAWDEAERTDFPLFCEILEAIFHFELRRQLETLKELYAPLDPDRRRTGGAPPAAGETLLRTFREVLEQGNFEEIRAPELDESLRSSALLRVTLRVDRGDLAHLHIFRRGRRLTEVPRRRLFGLLRRAESIELYERVVLLVRFEEREYFEARGRRDLLFVPGSTLVKIFKDLPRGDLEMLFPNIQVVMGWKDRLLLGVPMLLGGIPLLLTKVLPSLLVLAAVAGTYVGLEAEVEEDRLQQAVAALGGISALGCWLFQQWTKVWNARIRFQKELADNLYFRCLDSNAGVFHFLVDAAEEEECKEAFLAYAFLRAAAGEGARLPAAALDGRIEAWFRERHGCELDFEVDDGLAKLERLGLLAREPEGRLEAVPLGEALRRLDRIWDGYFPHPLTRSPVSAIGGDAFQGRNERDE